MFFLLLLLPAVPKWQILYLIEGFYILLPDSCKLVCSLHPSFSPLPPHTRIPFFRLSPLICSGLFSASFIDHSAASNQYLCPPWLQTTALFCAVTAWSHSLEFQSSHNWAVQRAKSGMAEAESHPQHIVRALSQLTRE